LFKEEKDGECLRQSAPGRRQKKKNSGRRLWSGLGQMEKKTEGNGRDLLGILTWRYGRIERNAECPKRETRNRIDWIEKRGNCLRNVWRWSWIWGDWRKERRLLERKGKSI
jgi:hypothetical protein